jgi:hypothetical protein
MNTPRLTQCDYIINWLQNNEWITPKDALREFDCMRLQARIYDLKKAGYNIKTEIYHYKNSYGEHKCYAKYKLIGQIKMDLNQKEKNVI